MRSVLELHFEPLLAICKTDSEGNFSIGQKLLKSYPDACLILVPRHPERFESVYQLTIKTGLSVQRRSLNELPSGQIYLGDTMGELLMFCALADMAFVGGSLVKTGGHNCLEVSAFAKPVMSGPHDFNFAEINTALKRSGGLSYVTDADSTCQQLTRWIQEPRLARGAGRAGLAVVEENRGALSKLLNQLAQYLD